MITREELLVTAREHRLSFDKRSQRWLLIAGGVGIGNTVDYYYSNLCEPAQRNVVIIMTVAALVTKLSDGIQAAHRLKQHELQIDQPVQVQEQGVATFASASDTSNIPEKLLYAIPTYGLCDEQVSSAL